MHERGGPRRGGGGGPGGGTDTPLPYRRYSTRAVLETYRYEAPCLDLWRSFLTNARVICHSAPLANRSFRPDASFGEDLESSRCQDDPRGKLSLATNFPRRHRQCVIHLFTELRTGPGLRSVARPHRSGKRLPCIVNGEIVICPTSVRLWLAGRGISVASFILSCRSGLWLYWSCERGEPIRHRDPTARGSDHSRQLPRLPHCSGVLAVPALETIGRHV